MLLMDDDAASLDGEAIERALTCSRPILGSAADSVRAVRSRTAPGGTRGCSRHAAPWRATCRRSSALRTSSAATTFVAIGGYRESFEFYGEEKDFCLRLIDAGYRTVYLPDALVIHEPDQAGRSRQRYLRYVTRNDCLTALYNEPLSRLVWLLAGAPGAVLPHAPRLEGRRPVGLGLDPARAVAQARDPCSGTASRCHARPCATWKRLRREPEAYKRRRLNRLNPEP